MTANTTELDIWLSNTQIFQNWYPKNWKEEGYGLQNISV